MTLGRSVSPTAILIFGIAIAITFSLRAACDVNEIAYESVCENTLLVNAIPPDFPAQDKTGCDKNDSKTVFVSAMSYFLEKYENSPPC